MFFDRESVRLYVRVTGTTSWYIGAEIHSVETISGVYVDSFQIGEQMVGRPEIELGPAQMDKGSLGVSFPLDPAAGVDPV